MTVLHIDFESFSACDLRSEGLDNYARHSSTGIHCMAWAFDDEPVQLWMNWQPIPLAVQRHVENDGLVYAHNSAFELAIWNHILHAKRKWPRLDEEQTRCTMAMAYAMGLPGKLEHAAPALGISERKDTTGARIMMQLAQPKKDGSFWVPADDPEKFQKLYDYCRQDVAVERAMHKRLVELSEHEQAVWNLDYRINQRGIRVDLKAIDQAIKLVEQQKQKLNAEMLKITEGVVGSCSEVQLLVKWIRSQGVEMPGVAKADVLDALSDPALPWRVRAALDIRKEAAKSSTAKLASMKARADKDGIIRNAHQYHGAATGRWAGRGIQVQNLPRPRPGIGAKQIQEIVDHFDQPDYLDMMYGPVLDAVADSIRGMIVPRPGHHLIACDFSAVEARVLAWLAGEQSVLEVFKSHGKIYEHAAAGIYRKPMEDITKDERQIGKVAVLALGFQGSVGAFQQMARGYNVKVSDALAKEVTASWRNANPHIVRYWYALENVALEALRILHTVKVGPQGREVAFKKNGSFLWCRLPSGRVLCYPYPEIREVETPWGEPKEALTYMASIADTKGKVLPDPNASGKWQRISTYGGSLAENVTQAVARDLLADAMLRMEAAGYQTVMHVHDEAVIEVPETAPESTLGEVEKLMAQVPSWAEGLPLAAEGWRGTRYRK